eukprot:3530278-Rhodomonas_salina.1
MTDLSPSVPQDSTRSRPRDTRSPRAAGRERGQIQHRAAQAERESGNPTPKLARAAGIIARGGAP